MSGVAGISLAKGHRVSGSDLKESDNTGRLQALGATVHVGHREENLGSPDLVVISSAIGDDNPELALAKEKGIPVLHRMDMLLEVVKDQKTIVVAGSHGKTTVASMIAWILCECGQKPTYLLGGSVPGLGNWGFGEGPWAVVEADESDGSFLKIRPDVGLVTNIGNDHMEYWGSLEALQVAFFRFLDSSRHPVVCVDDPSLARWAESRPDALTYSVRSDLGLWHGTEVRQEGWSTKATVGNVKVMLNHPGLHNIQNGLGALAASSLAGVPLECAARGLESFPGAKRRMQMIGVFKGVTVIDDFAHHPDEMIACLNGVRGAFPGKRIILLFQPHRYSRTTLLKGEFEKALGEADASVTCGIYAGPGERVTSPGEPLLGTKNSLYVPCIQEAARRAVALTKRGDVLLTMGAGDVWKSHGLIQDLLRERAE